MDFDAKLLEIGGKARAASGVQPAFRPSPDFLHLGHPGIDVIYGIERLTLLLTNGNY